MNLNTLNLKLWKIGLLAGLTLAALLHPEMAGATTRTVTTTSDSGPGSLRQTIIDSAGTGLGDTINFVVTGTITLTSGELLIGRNLTVIGPGAKILTVSGNNSSRVFNISAGVTVIISNLSVSNGNVVGRDGYDLDPSPDYPWQFPGEGAGGGGILNQGTLHLANCAFNNNSVRGGMGDPMGFQGGGSANGGAIQNHGALNLVNCTFNNNSCSGGSSGTPGGDGNGGAIANLGTVSLLNCTLNGNSAYGGDGLSNRTRANGGNSAGGAIVSLEATPPQLTLVNCTISNNRAASGQGGGIFNAPGGDGGSCTGGGVSGDGIYLNTIVANNTATAGAGGTGTPPGSNGSTGGPDVGDLVSSQGHNLISRTDGSAGWIPSDLIGTIATPQGAGLGPLADNGGPTLTMALLPTSAAIDAADDAVFSSPYNLTTDQRGLPRKSGAHVDIGAYEVNPSVVTNTNDSGAGSLRDAIFLAAPGDTVNFLPAVTGTIVLTSGELIFGKNVNINGPGAKILTVSGNNASRIFHITGGASTISNLRIANGHTSSGGGGIQVENGSLSLNNCAVAACYAAGDGGATGGGGILALGSTTLSLVGSTLSGNSSPDYGGGLYLFNGASATLVNSTVSGNSTLDSSSDGGGGGIYVINGSTLNVTDSTIANNSSATAGGGVYKGFNGTATFRNSLIAGNSAPGGPDCKGPFVSAGYNLIGNSTGSTGFGFTGDQLNLSPMIGPLADNGGPTFTHALLTGSPAIDKGYSFGVTIDQRGSVRPYDNPSIPNASGGDGSDIGAFEVQAPNGPLLTATRSGNGVVIAWPSPSTGFVLQQNASGVGSANWSTVLTTPNDNGTTKTIIVTPPTGNRFYRLKQ